MKKLLLCAMLLICSMFQLSVFAQNYHEDDKEGLRQFLRQPSAEIGKLNLDLFDLSVADTVDWRTSEKWVKSIDARWAFSFNNSIPKRIVEIRLRESASGKLDCSRFADLNHLFAQETQISSVDVLHNINLISLDCSKNRQLTSLDLSGNPNLITLNCGSTQFASLDLSGNPNLIMLNCGSTQFASLDLSGNPNLKTLNCANSQIVSLDLSGNPALVSLDCGSGQLVSLDLSGNLNLKRLFCGGGAQLTNLDLSKNKELTNISCFDSYGLTSLDLSNLTKLDTLYLGYTQLTELDLSKNLKLSRVSLFRNQLARLYLPKNNDIRYLLCDDNKLTSVDLSGCPSVEMLSFTKNLLTEIDVSGISSLVTLFIEHNLLTKLDVSANSKLEFLYCNNNLLRSLDVSANPKLKFLHCFDNLLTEVIYPNIYFGTSFRVLQELSDGSNYLRFSQLLFREALSSDGVIRLNHAPQKTIDAGEMPINRIDFSSEYNIGGVFTSYKWYDASGMEIVLESVGDGIFKAPAISQGQILTCKMTNRKFSKANYYYTYDSMGMVDENDAMTIEYKVKLGKVIAENFLQDHLKLKTATDNVYSVNIDESFKVYAKVNNQDAVKIGLFSSQGIFKGQIDLSRKNSTYTCQVPSNTNEGDYIILPYIVEAGVRVPVARADKSHLIDQLPVKVIAEDIWGRSIAVYSEGNVLKNLQLKTAENNLFEVAVEQQFQVYAPASESSTSIGLFDLDGVFLSDIAVAKNSYTYKCEVPFEFEAGNYIIMPYVKEGDLVKVVERSVGAVMIDRLPLSVTEGDIWSRSIGLKTVNLPLDVSNAVSVYPNPVTDLLYFNTPTLVNAVEIYDMAGRLVKKITSIVGNSVSVQDLVSGIYAVKIKTSENETMHKIKKN